MQKKERRGTICIAFSTTLGMVQLVSLLSAIPIMLANIDGFLWWMIEMKVPILAYRTTNNSHTPSTSRASFDMILKKTIDFVDFQHMVV
jgi:hypothetical protein